MSRLRLFFLILCTTYYAGLAGCSASGEPRRIAAYPSGGQGSSGAGFEDISGQLIYQAELELEVGDPGLAARQAERLVENYGGYVSGSQRWTQNGRRGYTLVLEVPWRYFESLRADLVRLGTLKREDTTGEWIDAGSAGRATFSQITLYLVPAYFSWPSIEPPGGHPLRTLQRALNFSLSIFGFLLDVLIWVVVVGGPFVLLSWGLKKLILKIHR